VKEWIDKLRQALGERRYAFQKTFNGPLAELVLKDLARFCRAHESTFESTERDSLILEGRRQVWLRLQEHLRLSPDQLWVLYTGRPASGE
jgi:hypothetical protein